MDSRRVTVRASAAVWLRLLLVLAVLLSATELAHAQAPPPAFYDHRSTDDLRALALDVHNDVLLRRGAATRLVLALADRGDVDAADDAGREFARVIDPRAIMHIAAVRRRLRVHLAAEGALGLTLGLAMLSLLASRVRRRALPAVRRVAPALAVFLLHVALVGGYLASTYENSSPVPFFWFAALMVPLLVLFRAWSAVGSPRLAARLARGGAAAAAAIALGFLVVEHVNPGYLEGFGL